jgi:DNA-binding SARP family transcriptional activator
MEFGLLGPLDVRRGGVVVDVGAPRERLVLTVLLLNANHVVSSARLIEIVWGADPPTTARHSVQVSLSRLRAALNSPDDERIVSRSPGYLLRAEPQELDVERCRIVAASAEEAVSSGDHLDAVRRYDAAARLWRGVPLEEFAGLEWADTAAAALAHDHARVIEGRIASRLALGHGADLVSELELLVHENPARERLRGQLMVALYQCGRQADALNAYQDARRYLRDELGVDPGPELRELHQAILRHDASIRAPRTAHPASSTARQAIADHDVDAERRIVTILVANLDTTPAGSDDPEAADHAATRFHSLFRRIVDEAGGEVEELDAGSARASFGGGPVDDHADRALVTALRLRDDNALGLVRVGVAGGEVLRRTVPRTTEPAGSRTSVGRPVVQAIVLAHEAAPATVLIEPAVLNAVRGSYSVGPRRLTSDGAAVHPLLGQEPAGVQRALGGLRRGFLGRESELASLSADFHAVVRDGHPRLVTIVGDPGVGKSTLLAHAQQAFGDEGASVLVGQCLGYGRGITYRPLAEILRRVLDVPEGEPASGALHRLGDEADAFSPVFGGDVLEPVHPTAARDRLCAAWVRLLERLSASQPVVVVVEDVHWAEQPLLDVIDHLVREVVGPVLVVTTARPEFVERPRPSHRRASIRWLEPLDDDVVRRLVDHLLAQSAPAGLADVIVGRADGFPFFVEELLATLIERQALTGSTTTGWQFETDVDGLVLPDTIRSVLAARVDHLAAQQKSVLQVASVIGRRFDGRIVRRLVGPVEPDFTGLVERDLLRRRRSDRADGDPLSAEELYEFKHALTRDVAYASLSRSRRPRLHAAVARDVEAVSGDGDDRAPILAHHFTAAVRDDDRAFAWTGRDAEFEELRRSAVDWLIRAGRLCISRMAIDEGISLLEQALAHDPAPDVQADAWRAIGRGHALRYDGPQCWAAMLRAVELYDDETRQGAAYAELAMETVSRYGMMDMPDRQLVTSWIDRAIALSAPTSAARAQALIARTIWFPADAHESAADAVAAADALGDPSLRSHAYCARAAVSYLAGDYQDADQWSQRMLALVPALDDPDVVVDVYGGAVPSLLAQGKFDVARSYVDEHGAVAWTLSDHHRVHAVSMHLELDEVAGDWVRVRELTERTVSIVDANSATPCQRNARSPLVCAYAHLVAGDVDRAEELEALAEEQALAGHSSILNPMRLRLAVERGDLDTMRRLVAPEPAPPPWKHWYQLVSTTIRLSALCALGDAPSVEREAPVLLRPGTYLEPFGLQSLGLVRSDESLLRRASECFDTLGLPWHRDRLGAVLDGR